MKVIVRSAISELEFDAPPKALARDIFKLMCKNLLIVEIWYFGLMYRNAENDIVWIDGSKKNMKDLRNVSTKLNFRVKYYPEDVSEELIEKSTIELFFSQIRNAIFRDEIYCPADTCALLASYALQAKLGDYCDEGNNNSNGQKTIKNQKLIPDRIINQHRMDISVWEQNIVNMWKKHRNLDTEDAMLEYLKLVQNLEMYGVSYFDITNRKGTNLLLGVNALGLNIYKTDDKLNPQISFPWSEIKNLKFRDKKFIIKPVGKSATDFIFFTNDSKTSKHILQLGIGNHGLYIKRRKPESPEIVRMKEKAREVKRARQKQKEKLNLERAAREEVERRENEYKTLIKSMKEEMEKNQENLLEAQLTIKNLQQQLRDLQLIKEELEQQQQELKEMMQRFEDNKTMELEERQKLEDEIREKQLEVQRIQQEVEEKDAETQRLQDEIEMARLREEELVEAARLEEKQKLQQQEQKNGDETDLETLPEGADTALPELSQVNEQLLEQLKVLQDELDKSRKLDQDSELDKIHRVNLRDGRDKYKTLADIRRGNTIRRVEMFENM